MDQAIKVLFDSEADFLEVNFRNAPCLTVATDDDAVMKRVDAEGRILGFSVLGGSKRVYEKHPLRCVHANWVANINSMTQIE